MATVTHIYLVGDTVFYVNESVGIREAIVSSVNISIKNSGTVITYVVSFIDTAFGVSTLEESELYADVDAALVAYRDILTS